MRLHTASCCRFSWWQCFNVADEACMFLFIFKLAHVDTCEVHSFWHEVKVVVKKTLDRLSWKSVSTGVWLLQQDWNSPCCTIYLLLQVGCTTFWWSIERDFIMHSLLRLVWCLCRRRVALLVSAIVWSYLTFNRKTWSMLLLYLPAC